jgi:hypothetical protein
MVTREGRTQKVGLGFVPEAIVGDLLLVHSGQAFRICREEQPLPPVTTP